MRPSQFAAEQMIGMLTEQEAGAKTVDVCRKCGLSAAAFLVTGNQRLPRTPNPCQRCLGIGASGIERLLVPLGGFSRIF